MTSGCKRITNRRNESFLSWGGQIVLRRCLLCEVFPCGWKKSAVMTRPCWSPCQFVKFKFGWFNKKATPLLRSFFGFEWKMARDLLHSKAHLCSSSVVLWLSCKQKIWASFCVGNRKLPCAALLHQGRRS